jgi:hypothetical protein
MDDVTRRRMDDASLDEAIRRLVEAAGSDAPDPPAPGTGPLVPIEPPARTVRWLVPVLAGAAVVSLLIVIAVASGRTGDDVAAPGDSAATVSTAAIGSTPTTTPTTATGVTTSAPAAPAAASRPILGNAEASCVEEYDLTTLAGRAWAFDGTVRAITPPAEGAVDTAVEFDVHEWFGIDGPATVTVDLTPPQVRSSVEPPEYGVGSRLLVSGEPRWGGDPLDEPVAWLCGFTRTWDEPTASAWRTASADRPTPGATSAPALTRPVADPAICPSRYARDSMTKGVSLFARRSTSPVPIQVIADPATGPTGPFAMVQRYFTDEWLRPGAETVEVDGVTYQLGVFDNGNGSLEWEVGDGTIGYVRSRGLSRDDLLMIAVGLSPRPPDDAIPGFDVDAAALPEPLDLLDEQLNTEVSGEVHRSACVLPGTTVEYRISAISGDPIFEYGGVIDRPAPLSVGMIDGTVVVIDGPDDPAAPTIADVISTDRATWDELLTRSEAPEGVQDAIEVTVGEPVEVMLQTFDGQVGSSPLVVRVVEDPDVTYLQVETAGAVLHPDAVLWKVDIQGRGGGLRSATVGPVSGYRIADTPFTGEINVEISVIDGGDFTLQTTGQIRLVVP